MLKKLLKVARTLEDKGHKDEAQMVVDVIRELRAAEGIHPRIHNVVKKCKGKGMSFEEAKKCVKEETGWDLSKEDWEEAGEKKEAKKQYKSREEKRHPLKKQPPQFPHAKKYPSKPRFRKEEEEEKEKED